MRINTLVAVLTATSVVAHHNGFVHTGVEKKSVGANHHSVHKVARSAAACDAKLAKRDEGGVSFAQQRRVEQIKKARIERGIDPDSMPLNTSICIVEIMLKCWQQCLSNAVTIWKRNLLPPITPLRIILSRLLLPSYSPQRMDLASSRQIPQKAHSVSL